MRGSRRPAVARSRETRPKKKPGLTCILPFCSHPKLVEVTPEQVEMTETDIHQVRLNQGGTLLGASHCGCVTEADRHKDQDRQYRKVGEYDNTASPNRFTIRKIVLDEYLCLVKNSMYCPLDLSGELRYLVGSWILKSLAPGRIGRA